MALVNCPECGREISSSAPTCPQCGASLPRRRSGAFVARALGCSAVCALAVVGALFAIFSADNNANHTEAFTPPRVQLGSPSPGDPVLPLGKGSVRLTPKVATPLEVVRPVKKPVFPVPSLLGHATKDLDAFLGKPKSVFGRKDFPEAAPEEVRVYEVPLMESASSIAAGGKVVYIGGELKDPATSLAEAFALLGLKQEDFRPSYDNHVLADWKGHIHGQPCILTFTRTRLNSGLWKGIGAKVDRPETEASGISMRGYQRLRNGMSYDQVVFILGDDGTELSRGQLATVVYVWRGRPPAAITATFQNGKLMQKAQSGLQ